MTYVVSIDGSESSRAAIRRAARLADRLDTTLTLVHAVEPAVKNGAGCDGTPIQEGFDGAESRGRAVLDRGHAVASDAGVSPETELLHGNPVDEIVEYLEDSDCEGVFIGHRALGERYESMVGSFAKKLIGRSPVPVTVVSA